MFNKHVCSLSVKRFIKKEMFNIYTPYGIKFSVSYYGVFSIVHMNKQINCISATFWGVCAMEINVQVISEISHPLKTINGKSHFFEIPKYNDASRPYLSNSR